MTTEHFTTIHWNRWLFPTKHVLVCEDDIAQQARIAAKLSNLFSPQGKVQVSFVPGAMAAAGVILARPGLVPDLILLDHDMPYGTGPELVRWLRGLVEPYSKIPIITFSGIPENNDRLMAAGADHKFRKDDVIDGAADEIIWKILGPEAHPR